LADFFTTFLVGCLADFFTIFFGFVARAGDFLAERAGALVVRPRAGADRFAPVLVLPDFAARRPPPVPAAGI
jgi:hypothetical protein